MQVACQRGCNIPTVATRFPGGGVENLAGDFVHTVAVAAVNRSHFRSGRSISGHSRARKSPAARGFAGFVAGMPRAIERPDFVAVAAPGWTLSETT